MDRIEATIAVYERLRKHKYRITVENGDVIDLAFLRENYHHLAGYQHLSDMPIIQSPPGGTDAFYGRVKNGHITEKALSKSAKYNLIEKRLSTFFELENILSAGKQKIIIRFDKTKADTVINAIYFLYKKNGAPYSPEYSVCMLFIGYDPHKKKYYPTTYVVEESNKYFNDQDFLNCTIEVLAKQQKKHQQ